MYTNIGPWLISKQSVDWVADAPARLEAIQKRALAEGLPYWQSLRPGIPLACGELDQRLVRRRLCEASDGVWSAPRRTGKRIAVVLR